MKNLIIIGGTAGVGKTTTCRELQKILPRNVFLDGDWCWDMHPFVVTEETKAMVNSNIAHLLNGFLACSEFENVIFCWVLHEQHILDDLINALNLNGCTTHCFSLVSTERALVERLNRDIAAGKRSSDITERSVARISLYDELDTVKIDVSTISPADAARRITEHMAGVRANTAHRDERLNPPHLGADCSAQGSRAWLCDYRAMTIASMCAEFGVREARGISRRTSVCRWRSPVTRRSWRCWIRCPRLNGSRICFWAWIRRFPGRPAVFRAEAGPGSRGRSRHLAAGWRAARCQGPARCGLRRGRSPVRGRRVRACARFGVAGAQLASRVQSRNRSRAGTESVPRKAPLTASATAVITAPAPSQRGRARARKARMAVAAQNTARGYRLSTVAPPPIASIAV